MQTQETIIQLPEDSERTGYPHDAMIDRDAWLRTVSEEVNLAELVPESLAIDASKSWLTSPLWCKAMEYLGFEPVYTENTYNQENDFDADFQFTVYAHPDDSDWPWSDVYVAVTLHCGGDPRGNYRATEVYYVESPAESGFLDWVLGWVIEEMSTDGTWKVNERLSERLSIGYSPNPGCELMRQFEEMEIGGRYGEEGEWRSGHFYPYIKGETPAQTIRATPYTNVM